MKSTKNINGTFYFDTGKWYFRDNGKILASGQGFLDFVDTEIALKKANNKPVKVKIIY